MHAKTAPSQPDLLQIRHKTVYRYHRPVIFNEHRGMFRPHDSHDQRLLDIQFRVSPDARIRWVHDVFSNAATIFNFPDTPSDALEIECVMRVYRNPVFGEHFPLTEFARRFPFEYPPEQLTDLRPSIVATYPDDDQSLLKWAQGFATEAGGDTWETLRRMNAAIHQNFIYNRREEPGVQPPAETLSMGAGSCRDFAVLMLEAVRRLNFAGRFVTGYLYDPSLDNGETVMQGSGATHAWLQIFLPGAGWVEFDPTNGLIDSTNLIRTGVARTPDQAVPLRGTYKGAAEDTAGFTVEVEVTTAANGSGQQ